MYNSGSPPYITEDAMLDVLSTAPAIYVSSASLGTIESFRNGPLSCPISQHEITVMTSGITSQSSVQQFILSGNKETLKERVTVPLWEESSGGLWIPRTKGQ